MSELSETSHGFDLEFGRWNVKHRRLTERLVNSTDWETFDGTTETHPILGGNGNLEDNVLHISTGTYRTVALRSFNAVSRSWAIWWLDGRSPRALDMPVIGKFEDGVGTFFAEDVYQGKPLRVRFIWSRTDSSSPRWEQAMSVDGGVT
jgi:hypothetical protein